MKAGIVSDYRIGYSNNSYYINGLSTYERNFKRYINIFGEISYLGRIKELENVNGYIKVDDKNVAIKINSRFKHIKDFFTKRNQISLEIKKFIDSNENIIIHMPTIQGIIAAKYCKKIGKKYLIEQCGDTFAGFWNYGNIYGKVLAPIMHMYNKKANKSASHVLYVTDNYLQKKYSTNGIMGSGLSNVELKPVSLDIVESKIQKYENMTKDSELHIGLMGSMDLNYKGHRTAIKTVGILKKKYNVNVTLHFIGTGCFKRWKKMAKHHNIEEYVLYDGMLTSGDAVNKWIDQIDFYIQPSLQEGLARSVIESMSRGAICFGSYEGGGMAEILDINHLFKAKNSSELANKIFSSLLDPKELVSYSQKNYMTAKKFYQDTLNLKRREFYLDFTSKS